MMYVRYPLSLRNVEDLLHVRGIDICHESIRYWWSRFGPMFASEIRKKRMHPSANYSNWRWHLDQVFVTKRRNRKATLIFLKKTMKRYGKPHQIVTDRLKSYRAAMKVIGNQAAQEVGGRKNNRCENSHLPFRWREYAILRFRRMRSLQKFTSIHSSVYNHFNLERHMISRHQFKKNRITSLSEWRQLAV